MRKQDIEIVISPTGEVTFTAKGIKGSSCLDETKFLEQALGSAGCDVDSAADGQEALAKVRTHRPDVVVTDWQMPRMDGLTLCRILKASDETRFTHVLMLSARGETEAKAPGLGTGADEHVVKPVAPV